MPIRMKLSELIDSETKKMGKLNKLSAATNIRWNTLNDYDKGVAVSFKEAHIATLCEFFGIQDFNELFEWVEDPKQKEADSAP